jgi:hypothetical protein
MEYERILRRGPAIPERLRNTGADHLILKFKM